MYNQQTNLDSLGDGFYYLGFFIFTFRRELNEYRLNRQENWYDKDIQ